MAQAMFMQRVLANFGATLLMASMGAYVGWSLPVEFYLPLVLVEFGLLLAVVFLRRMARVGPLLLFGFAAISGATTVPVIQWAIAVTHGTAVVYNALAATGAVFCVMAWYGSATKRDLSGWSTFLWMGLIGALVASFVGLFVAHSTGFELMLSGGIVIVFTGFVAYDINQIRENWRAYDVTGATLNLYLDFLNLFVGILRILAVLNGMDRRD